MLTLALLLAGLAPAPLALDVPIYLGAELSEEIVVSALRETQRIFEPGGIELRFDLSPENHSSRPLVTVLMQPRPARFKVYGCSRDRHDHRLGHTQLRAQAALPSGGSKWRAPSMGTGTARSSPMSTTESTRERWDGSSLTSSATCFCD